jgi:hypothetical protein
MSRPASFRLAEELLSRVGQEAAERQTSVTALLSMLLDEASNYAGLRGLPIGRTRGQARRRCRRRMALDFYAAPSDEIDERIAANEQAARR